jgi:hypothetical protein
MTKFDLASVYSIKMGAQKWNKLFTQKNGDQCMPASPFEGLGKRRKIRRAAGPKPGAPLSSQNSGSVLSLSLPQ